MAEPIMLSSSDAIKYISDQAELSHSDIAAMLTAAGDGVKVQPIQIKNYASGKHSMSEKVAIVFTRVFDIVIVDAFKATGRPKSW